MIRHPYNKGNGAAVKTGIRQTTGAFVLIIDADGQHAPADAARLVSHLGAYDLRSARARTASQATARARLGNAPLNGLSRAT